MLNTLLASANILKTLQRQSLGHATSHLSEKVPKDWLSLMRYSNLKSFSFMFQQNLIETLYVPVVFIFPDRKFKPKCLQW